MKKINGSVKQFVLINSTNYNEDGNYQVIIGDLEDMKQFGGDKEWIEELDRIGVDSVALTDIKGCYAIRIA